VARGARLVALGLCTGASLLCWQVCRAVPWVGLGWVGAKFTPGRGQVCASD
jgi:hypothetical protein